MAEIYGFTIRVDGNAVQEIRRIEGSLQGLNNSTQQVASSMSSSMSGFANTMKGVLGAMGIASAVGGLVNMSKSILKLGSDMQQTNISFEVMLGSAEKAKNMVADIQKFASVTPFTSTEISEATKMLLNYGVSQGEVMKDLQMMGDASGGNAEKFKGMTYAFAQISATGRLMGQDLLQLVNAGFNPLQEISRKTGKSMSELKDAMSKGQISAQMVRNAFASATGEGGRFYGMMDKQSKTVAGLWSTFVDNLQMKAIAIFNKIQPYLTKFLEYGIAHMGAFMNTAKSIWNAFTPIFKVIGSFIELIKWINGSTKGATALRIAIEVLAGAVAGYLIVAKGALLITKLQAWWTGMSTTAIIINTLATEGLSAAWTALSLAMTLNPIGLIVAAFVALGVLIWKSIEHFKTWGAAVMMVAMPLVNVVMSLVHYWDEIKKAFTDGGFIDGIKKIGKAIVDAVLYPLQQMLGLIGKITGLESVKKWGEDLAKYRKENNFTLGNEENKKESGTNKANKSIPQKGSTNALTEGAFNLATTGAKGGLGEAKVINIKIDTMQKNDVKNVQDFDRASDGAIEILTRALNNLVYSQSSTM